MYRQKSNSAVECRHYCKRKHEPTRGSSFIPDPLLFWTHSSRQITDRAETENCTVQLIVVYMGGSKLNVDLEQKRSPELVHAASCSSVYTQLHYYFSICTFPYVHSIHFIYIFCRHEGKQSVFQFSERSTRRGCRQCPVQNQPSNDILLRHDTTEVFIRPYFVLFCFVFFIFICLDLCCIILF